MKCNSLVGLQGSRAIIVLKITILHISRGLYLKIKFREFSCSSVCEISAVPMLCMGKRNLSNVFQRKPLLQTFTYQYYTRSGKTKWALDLLAGLKSLFLNAICCYDSCCVFNDYLTCKQNAILVLYSCNSWWSQTHAIRDRNNIRVSEM
jgi:hypothetical protein